MSEALTNLAKQFGQYGKSYFETAFPGYKSGMEYFQTLLTGDRGAIQAATAPTTEAIASQYGAQRRSLGAGLLRGGARDLAEAELARSEASDIARTYSGVQPGAAQSLMQGGLEGSQVAESFLGMAGNTYSNLVNTAVTSRLTTEGMNLQRELGLKQISAQVSIAQMQNQTARDLGFAGLDLQYKSLQEQVAQFNRTAGTQESQFNRTFGFQQRQALFAQQQAKGSANAQLMMGAMALMLAKSDERLKQDIQPLPESRDVLGALSTLRGVTFRWRHAPDAPTEIGVIAQDVQKVLPELVHTPGPDGYLVVDYQKLTAYLIEVAKAQQAQLTTLSARIAALEGRKE